MSDIRLYLIVGLLVPGVIYGIFQAPPLTSRESNGPSAFDQNSFEVFFDQERDYCEAQPNDYDCQCYARVSGIVQASRGIQARGAQSVDRQHLARMQASGRC